MSSGVTVERRDRLAGSDGFMVATWTATPERLPPRGVVVLCHGLTTGADDDGPFLPLRDRLVRAGLMVIRFDARAHGETGGSWRDLSLRGWADDIRTVLGLAEELGGVDQSLFVLAASFSAGPAVTAATWLGDDCDGLVLWNPVLDYRRTYLSAECWAGQQVRDSRGAAWLPDWADYGLPWIELPFSRDLVAEFRADQTPERVSSLSCPVLTIHGRRDRFVPYAGARDSLAGAGNSRLVALPILGHGFRGARPLVRALTVRWLRARLKDNRRLPGGSLTLG